MAFRHYPPLDPVLWQRCDTGILPLWWDRLSASSGPESASHFASGLFATDRRRPIAQWHNAALDAAMLVAPETTPEWPVQRFGIFYAPPGRGVIQVHTGRHEWHPFAPRQSPTEAEAFADAIASAEAFLQVEMAFG